MDWQLVLLIMFGGLIVMMAAGMPVAFSFLAINMVGLLVVRHGDMDLLVRSIFGSVTSFTLLPIPMFILMGDVLFQSGMGSIIIDSVDKWMGRLPGRMSLLAVGAGTLLATLTGASMASVAMLGSTLIPEMEKRGYKKPMSLGPILGSGGLATMIPPSGLAVLLGALGEISIGQILLAIILPGLLSAVIFTTYIVTRCRLDPTLAPPYEITRVPLSEKLAALAKHILPISIIVFLVIGLIVLGIATPTEAAVSGVLGTLLLVASHKRLSWAVMKKSLASTLHVTGMILFIIASSGAFSQILAFGGVSRNLTELATGLPVTPILIFIAMQLIVGILGMFMNVLPIMMITLPVFMPVVNGLGFNPVWFAVIYLINAEIAAISPPFGLNLFVMKGVAPPGTTMGDIYKAGLPFIVLNVIIMAIVIVFPAIALWLPGRMG
ncbi:MAG: TRAP transporter large permease subunit [Chloroflexi bacterium]|nr:TRAP transporter large permease subunit [Chloroflexota bacterium]